MSHPNHLRIIQSFMVDCDENGNPQTFPSGTGYVYVFENDYHGDHDENWIVGRATADGKEHERWSAKHAAHIVWTDDRYTPPGTGSSQP